MQRPTWFIALFLLSLLGVFSSPVFAQEPFSVYAKKGVPQSPKFVIRGSFRYSWQEEKAACNAICGGSDYYTPQNQTCIRTIVNSERIVCAVYEVSSTGSSPPADAQPNPYSQEDGSCVVASTAPECDFDADRDGDETPNVIDQDSGIYDQNFCTQEPTPQMCIDHNGGDTGWTPPDDSGDDDTCIGDCGGDSGGGSGGGDLGDWTPPSGAECDFPSDGEQCCESYAGHSCANSGGVASWGYSDFGGGECNVQCSDDNSNPDVPIPDGEDTTTEGEPFDDTDLLNSLDELKGINTSGLKNNVDAIGALEATNEEGFNAILKGIEGLDILGLADSIDATRESNLTGFAAVESAILQSTNNDDDDAALNALGNKISDSVTDIGNDIGIAIDEQTGELGQKLDQINSGISSAGDKIDSLEKSMGNFLKPTDEVNTDGIGDKDDGDLKTVSDLEMDRVDLDVATDDFDAPTYEMDCSPIAVDTSFGTIQIPVQIFCDLADMIRFLVLAAAYIASGFIVIRAF